MNAKKGNRPIRNHQSFNQNQKQLALSLINGQTSNDGAPMVINRRMPVNIDTTNRIGN